MASTTIVFLLLSSLALFSPISKANAAGPSIASGLAFGFYQSTCPSLEQVVRSSVATALSNNSGIAAGLIRVFFHDCFVQGCDASVLLTGTNSEQNAIPNQTLRPEALNLINSIRDAVQSSCGPKVSCADITTIAARDAVYLSGGPYYDVPLGRRDSLSPSSLTGNLPSPFSNVTTLISFFQRQNLNVTDLVALSGAHTVGIGHCGSFNNRLRPTIDSTLDQSFAQQLLLTCPNNNVNNSTFLDRRTHNKFDNKYFVDLVNNQGLFTSDQGLFSDSRTSGLVKLFAKYNTFFFAHFSASMIKMSQVNVLTGNNGQIRLNCAVANAGDEGYAAAE